MANLQRCPNGHFYDADKHPSCPYCEPTAPPDPAQPADPGVTQPLTDQGVGATQPLREEPAAARFPLAWRKLLPLGAVLSLLGIAVVWWWLDQMVAGSLFRFLRLAVVPNPDTWIAVIFRYTLYSTAGCALLCACCLWAMKPERKLPWVLPALAGALGGIYQVRFYLPFLPSALLLLGLFLPLALLSLVAGEGRVMEAPQDWRRFLPYAAIALNLILAAAHVLGYGSNGAVLTYVTWCVLCCLWAGLDRTGVPPLTLTLTGAVLLEVCVVDRLSSGSPLVECLVPPLTVLALWYFKRPHSSV